jgi:hypothetical protein
MNHNRVDILRIVLPALVAIGLFAFSSFYLYLPYFERCLLNEKKGSSGIRVLEAKAGLAPRGVNRSFN